MVKKPAKKPASKKPSATAATPAEGASDAPSKLLVVLSRVKARLPELTDVQLAAFHSLMTDTQRAALGGRTRGRAVASDAVAWIVQIDKDGREYPALFDFYAKERFAWFVESTGALVERLVAEGGKRAKKGAVEGSAASASDQAKALRKRLVRRIEAFAGDRSKERDELDAALGSIATDDDLAASIQGLVRLAKEWLGRTDAASKVLASAAKLTPALCDQALAAGKALTGAAADATEAGRGSGKDSPAVNVREGAVLREMREAMLAVEEAHEQHRTIRKLSPGPGTRQVLGPRRGATAAAPAPAPAGGEAAPLQDG
jgi:hypothetical protein